MTTANTTANTAAADLIAAFQMQLQAQQLEVQTISLGVSFGLLKDALDKRSPKAKGAPILFHYRNVNGIEIRFADKTAKPEQATALLEKMHAVACESKSVLELRGYMSWDLIEEALEGFEALDASYAQVSIKLLEPRIEAKKVQSLKEEGKWLPSLNLGQIIEIRDMVRANNPMADSSELTTEEDLIELIKEQAVRSRAGFNSWKGKLSTEGKTESSQDTSLDDLD